MQAPDSKMILALLSSGDLASRREGARAVARLARREFLLLDSDADNSGKIATHLRLLWSTALKGLKSSPRDARLASELKALAPALAIASPSELVDLVSAVLDLPDLMLSTREVLQKDFDRALVISAREAGRHLDVARQSDVGRHPERSEGSSSSRHPDPECYEGDGSYLQSEIFLCKSAPIALYCRAGLEDLLLDSARAMKLNARTSGRGLVLINMESDAAKLKPSPFAMLTSMRFWHDLGFVFPFPPTDGIEKIAALVAGPIAKCIAPFGTRVRFDWQATRAGNWDLATRLHQAGSALVNAPREADWDLMIDQEAGRIVAKPKSWFDLRFDYREKDVPAASHAPLAAALAALAELRPGEVVWDPFCGAGTEIIEAGLSQPRAVLFGSDIDPKAIEAARHNVRRAGVKADWLVGDFRDNLFRGVMEVVDVILTNPPLGRRVAPGEARAMADGLLEIASKRLRPATGRLVWVAPDAGTAAVTAKRLGLVVVTSRRVDLGGFDAEIQILRKSA